MEDGTLKAWKDLAAHNFIPKALVVGVLGNLINFVMLSRYAIKLVIYLSIFQLLAYGRPCIKSTTNIYLSILAFVDTSFMLLIHVLSKQYHADVHHQTHEIYWRMFGLIHWFYTAFRECRTSRCSRNWNSISFCSSQSTLQFMLHSVWLWIGTLLCAIPPGHDTTSLERRMSFRVSYSLQSSEDSEPTTSLSCYQASCMWILSIKFLIQSRGWRAEKLSFNVVLNLFRNTVP